MRRLIGLAAGLTAAVLAFAAPASAATVTHPLTHSFVVGAEWESSTDTSFSDTIVSAIAGTEPLLFVDQFTNFADSSAETTVAAASGFTLTHTALNTATLTATGVAATVCTFDADGNPTGCTNTTIDLSATWTGQGAISHDTFTSHFRIPGQFSEISHTTGAARTATAAGVVNGVTVAAANVDEADMIRATFGDIIICTGASC